MLCWLSAWADPSGAEHDRALHQLGQNFLQLVFAKHERRIPTAIKSIEIKKQHRSIDAVVVINKTIAICLEDKTGTTEHSGQLPRYVRALEDDGFSHDCILPVYVQTGEQGSYSAVRKAGYAVIRRMEIIDLFRAYLSEGGPSSIVRDFCDYLSGLEDKLHAFHYLPLAEWDSYAWQGFCATIQQVLGDGDWGYVPNPSGGFFGYWWNWHSDADSHQYVQIEQKSLCFKIEVEDQEKRSELRSKWNTRILEAAARENLNVVRPQRLGIGKTMTVAVLASDFRIVNSSGSLNMEATIDRLRKAAVILDRATSIESRRMAAGQAT
jgi:hypothetical protein